MKVVTRWDFTFLVRPRAEICCTDLYVMALLRHRQTHPVVETSQTGQWWWSWVTSYGILVRPQNSPVGMTQVSARLYCFSASWRRNWLIFRRNTVQRMIALANPWYRKCSLFRWSISLSRQYIVKDHYLVATYVDLWFKTNTASFLLGNRKAYIRHFIHRLTDLMVEVPEHDLPTHCTQQPDQETRPVQMQQGQNVIVQMLR